MVLLFFFNYSYLFTGAPYELSSASPETDSSSAEDAAAAAAASAASLALGRVYAATSLPAHIWSLNGEFSQLLSFVYGVGTGSTADFYYVLHFRR